MKKEPILFGVMGNPVGHSISPSIHSKFIESAGINAYYVPMSIEKKNLKDAILNASKLGFRGLNITIPYKEDVFKIIEEFGINDSSAKYCQAVNTVFYNDEKIYGYNTDGLGFVKSFEKQKDFLAGKLKKKKVTKREKDLLDILEKSQIDLVPVAQEELKSKGMIGNVECIFVKNMTKELLLSEEFPMNFQRIYEARSCHCRADNIVTLIKLLSTYQEKIYEIRNFLGISEEFPRNI
jgi:shikimate dehydrogenase